MAGMRSCLLCLILLSRPAPSGLMFLKKYFAERRQGFCENSSNRYIKISKYREEYQMSLEISRVYFSDSWQYWSNPYALTTAALFCFGQLVFKLVIGRTVSVFALPVVTEPSHRWRQKSESFVSRRKRAVQLFADNLS